jgi:hypothetical protein
MGILVDEGGMNRGVRGSRETDCDSPPDAIAILIATENSQKINRSATNRAMISGRIWTLKEQTTGD